MVSYQDDTIISDEADGEEEEENEYDKHNERLLLDLGEVYDQQSRFEVKKTQKRNESPIVVDDNSFDTS